MELTKEVKAMINQVIDYLWEDEKVHYMCDRSKDHIFVTLRTLKKEINKRRRNNGLQS